MTLSENMTLWPEEIIKQFLKDFPQANNYALKVNQLETNHQTGDYLGVVTIKDTGLSVFVVVKNGELAPFDMGMKDNRITAIDYNNIEKMLMPDGFADGISDIPRSKSSPMQNNDVTELSNNDGSLSMKMIQGFPVGMPTFKGAGAHELKGLTKELELKEWDENNLKHNEDDTVKEKVEQKTHKAHEHKVIKKDDKRNITKEIIDGEHGSGFVDLHKEIKDRMKAVEDKWLKPKKEAAVKLSSVQMEKLITEGVIKDESFADKCKFAAALELAGTDYRVTPKSDYFSVRYDVKVGSFLAKRAVYDGVDDKGTVKLKTEEDDVDSLGENERKSIGDSAIEKALATAKDAPITGNAKIIIIRKHTPFDASEPSIGSGAGLLSEDGGILGGLIKRLLGFDGLSGKTKMEDCGKGFVGKDEDDKTIFGKAEGLTGPQTEVPEDVFENAKPKKGMKIIIISGSDMTEPLEVKDGKVDSGPFDKNLPNPEMKAETKHGDEIKIKKDDSIEKMSFYNGVLTIPKNSKVVAIDSSEKLASIKKVYVTEEFLKEACDAEDESATKEASRRTKIRIFINKALSGTYSVESYYASNGMKFSDKVSGSSTPDVKLELERLGVSPMRAGAIVNNMKDLNESSISIEVEVDSKDIDAPSKSAMSIEKSAKLIKIADDVFGQVGDYDAMFNTFGSTLLDENEFDKFKNTGNDITKLIDELSEFALMKKITSSQQETDKIIKTINDLKDVVSMI